MKESWPEAIAFTFRAEGYQSNIVGDAGGATIYGISSAYWPHEFALIKAMTVENARAYAEEFYHTHFWSFIECDSLPYPMDCVAFDCSVNPGPSWCKSALTTTKDWRKLLDMREFHYERVAHPNVLKGLVNRCNALREKYKEAT